MALEDWDLLVVVPYSSEFPGTEVDKCLLCASFDGKQCTISGESKHHHSKCDVNAFQFVSELGCPHCTRTMEISAVHCPHCGKSPVRGFVPSWLMRLLTSWLLWAVVLSGLIFVAMGPEFDPWLRLGVSIVCGLLVALVIDALYIYRILFELLSRRIRLWRKRPERTIETNTDGSGLTRLP